MTAGLPCRPAGIAGNDLSLLLNPHWRPERPWSHRQDRLLPAAACRRAGDEIPCWPGYTPTPLVGLPALARALGVSRLHCKDEAARFGVGSFKALGAPFALAVLLAGRLSRRLGRRVTAAEVIAGSLRESCATVTVAAATDGNHGRALAWAASRAGCAAVIYVPKQISTARVAAIATLGARVERVDGCYDAAVHCCAADCRRAGWLEITDTAASTRPGAPGLASTRLVMAGYAVLVDEALEALAEAPTHLFAQAGVGGFAAVAAARLWQRLGSPRIRTVVVEPERAACLYASALAGAPSAATGDLATLMAGLACGEPSVLAWHLLDEAAAGFLVVPDRAAVAAMRLLAGPHGDDPALVAGESGAAGLAGLLAVAAEPAARRALELSSASRVLVVATEGATDPALYYDLVGNCPGVTAHLMSANRLPTGNSSPSRVDRQGNRISNLSQHTGEEAVAPGGPPELFWQRALGAFAAHQVECHVAQDGEVLRAIVQAVSRPVFVHGDVQAPV